MSDDGHSPEDPGGHGPGDAGGHGPADAGEGGSPGAHGQGGRYEDVGSLGEETAKLFGVLAGWANEVNDHVATDARECTYCPVCRTIHVVRECSPEVRDHLASAAASLMQAAAGVLAAAGERHAHDSSSQEGSTGPRSRTPVEHIDLDGDWPSENDRRSQSGGAWPRRDGHDE